MLRETQLEGLKDLLQGIGGTEESTNGRERERMKAFVGLAMASGLTPRQREIMVLLYGEGLSQREVAEKLGLCESAVSGRKKRAIERIKDLSKYMIQ